MILVATLPQMRGGKHQEDIRQVDRLTKAVLFFMKPELLAATNFDNSIHIHIDTANDDVRCYKKRVYNALMSCAACFKCVKVPSLREQEMHIEESDLVAWHPEKSAGHRWELIDEEW